MLAAVARRCGLQRIAGAALVACSIVIGAQGVQVRTYGRGYGALSGAIRQRLFRLAQRSRSASEYRDPKSGFRWPERYD